MADEHLLVRVGKTPGTRIAVDRELLLGRAAPNLDGRLGDDPVLSRRHARLVRTPDGDLTVEDLGSSNGTFVNGIPVEGSRVLRIGDVLRLGTTELAVTDPNGEVIAPTKAGELSVTRVPVPKEVVVISGPAEGMHLTIGDELVLGRAQQGDGRLGDDPELSRRHARIHIDDGRVTVEDLGSANGTFVNGERIAEPRALEPGDSVRVGRTTLELPGAPAAPAAAAAQPAAAAPSPPAVPIDRKSVV